MIQSIGQALNLRSDSIGGNVDCENLLVYMGMIEQAVGELVTKKQPPKMASQLQKKEQVTVAMELPEMDLDSNDDDDEVYF